MKVLRWFCNLAVLAAALFWLAPAAPAQESFRGVTTGVNKKLCKLFGAGGFKRLVSYGTGIVVSPKGHILTVNNLILDTADLVVHLYDGRKYHAKVMFKEPALDVALVKIEDKNVDDLPYYDIAAASKQPLAEAGDWVLAFSNQFKIATREEPMSVQRGTVSAYSKMRGLSGAFEASYRSEVYFVDAITNNPGAAGGVLTTRKGDLLGILGRELRNRNSDTFINYAVPIQAVAKILRQGKSETVDVSTFVALAIAGKYRKSDERPKKTDVNVDTGIILVPNVVERTPPYVEEVVPNSPAAKAGLKVDDLIVYLDGELVSTIGVLYEILAHYRPGDKIKLEVQRNNELVGVELTLGQPKEDK